jgi:hypothetical protein
MVMMIQGLWATVHFEPTADAIADERRGHVLIAAASVLLVALAAFARYVMSAPLVTERGEVPAERTTRSLPSRPDSPPPRHP